MKASIIGAGDITKISRFTRSSEAKVHKLIKDIASVLVKKGYDLVILPARGTPYLVAEQYKKAGGRKVIGLIPEKDKRFGIDHIKKYFGIEDEKQITDTWYELNGEIAAKGDVCIAVGMSPGVMTEICMLKYHYKYLGSRTKLIIFRNTLSQKLPKEVEEDLGNNIHYIKTVKELESLL